MSLKKKHIVFLIVSFSFSLFIIDQFKLNDIHTNDQGLKLSPMMRATVQIKDHIEQLRKNSTTKLSNEDQNRLSRKLSLVTMQISQLGNERDFQKTIQDIAKDLSPRDHAFYIQKAIDTTAPGDDRLAAVSILKEANESDFALAAIIIEPIRFLKDTHRQEQEFAFRAFAIEGLKSVSVIQNIQNQMDSPFLIDRLMRQKAFINRQTPSPEMQDQNALKKLIGQ
jgi:hypothetical protein